MRGKPLGNTCWRKRRRNSSVSQRHGTVLVVMSIVLPTKTHLIVVHREQPMIRDGNTMGVASQVLQHVLRSTKRRLGIHQPLLPEQCAQESGKGLFLAQWQPQSVKHELV